MGVKEGCPKAYQYKGKTRGMIVVDSYISKLDSKETDLI